MATFLEDGLDAVAGVPGEVQRALQLVRELDKSTSSLLEALKTKQTVYIKRVKDTVRDKPRTPGTDLRALAMDKEALSDIVATREEALQQSEEKVSVVDQLKHFLEGKIAEMDDHLREFEGSLRAANNFDPQSVPPDTPMMDGYAVPKRGRMAADPYGGDASGAGGGRSSSSSSSAASSVMPGSYAGYGSGVTAAQQGGYHTASHPMAAGAGVARRADGPHHAAAGATQVGHGGAMAHGAGVMPHAVSAATAPSEDVYCLCGQPSYGEMVGCDNDNCKTGHGWFHLQCVGLTEPPSEDVKWYCPMCRPLFEAKAHGHK